MKMYYDSVSKEIKEYFKILEPEFPEWLHEYINTPELLSQNYISVTCGAVYTKLFPSNFFFSSLDHSVAVALIVWHFTHDKKITLSALFHDIATPAFKHCIDFLNGDYMNQESTEDKTQEVIKNSQGISFLLNKDKIDLKEVNDYHIYPIADNSTPKLSADRLEYSLSNALFFHMLTGKETVKKIYNDLEIELNEEQEIELGFKTKSIARDFVKITSQLSIIYIEDRTRYSTQFIADILRRLIDENKLTINDLYKLKESEIINIIQKSKYHNIFNLWQNATNIKTSKEKPKNVYYIHHGAKMRYIDPLFRGKRISECCKIAKKMQNKVFSYNTENYVYLDFNFDD